MNKEERQDYDKAYYLKNKDAKKRVTLRYSPDEYRQIEKLSAAVDIPPAVLIKRLSLAAINGERFLSADSEEELQSVRFLIRNIANNVNQMAKHSNTLKKVVDENQLLAELRQLETLVHDYVSQGKGS